MRDVDDALCMIFLFANLPATSRVSTALIDNCIRLAAEWQLYVIHSHSLRKVFLSIKGVYYQAEVMGQNVTWLIPYQFTQNVSIPFSIINGILNCGKIPADVDVRVMLTFLELYQTLLGFVFFKLYADAGLVYPPPLDTKKDDGAAGVGAFSLQQTMHVSGTKQVSEPKISARDVRQVIKSISSEVPSSELAENEAEEAEDMTAEEDFVLRPSKSNPEEGAVLSTFKSLSAQEGSVIGKLFGPYTFWLSRETSRPIFEFVVCACGGRIGWPATSGSGSPFDESDETITHVIIDRPISERPNETQEERQRRLQRKYIQPQWVFDCINAGKILLEDKYAQGNPLPPHLSPFGDYEGAYDPTAANPGDGIEAAEKETDEDEGDPEVGEDEPESRLTALVAGVTDDLDALHAAELEAEAAGIDHDAFEREVKKTKKSKKEPTPVPAETEGEMNKMLMSNKKRKLYERMKYGQRKKDAEVGQSVSICGCFVVTNFLLFQANKTRAKAERAGWREEATEEGEGRSQSVILSGTAVIQTEYHAESKSDQPNRSSEVSLPATVPLTHLCAV